MEVQKAAPQEKKFIAINALAMGVFALFNPFLAYTPSPVVDWAMSLLMSWLFGLVACWLYIKLTRQTGRKSLAKGTVLAAWFVLASMVLVPYMDKSQKQSPAPQVQTYEHRASTPSPRVLSDEEFGLTAQPQRRVMTDEEFGLSPSQR